MPQDWLSILHLIRPLDGIRDTLKWKCVLPLMVLPGTFNLGNCKCVYWRDFSLVTIYQSWSMHLKKISPLLPSVSYQHIANLSFHWYVSGGEFTSLPGWPTASPPSTVDWSSLLKCLTESVGYFSFSYRETKSVTVKHQLFVATTRVV